MVDISHTAHDDYQRRELTLREGWIDLRSYLDVHNPGVPPLSEEDFVGKYNLGFPLLTCASTN